MAYGEAATTTPGTTPALSFLDQLNAGVPAGLRPPGVSDECDPTFWERLEAAAWSCRRATPTESPDGFLFLSAATVRDLRRKVLRNKRARLQALPPVFRYGAAGGELVVQCALWFVGCPIPFTATASVSSRTCRQNPFGAAETMAERNAWARALGLAIADETERASHDQPPRGGRPSDVAAAVPGVSGAGTATTTATSSATPAATAVGADPAPPPAVAKTPTPPTPPPQKPAHGRTPADAFSKGPYMGRKVSDPEIPTDYLQSTLSQLVQTDPARLAPAARRRLSAFGQALEAELNARYAAELRREMSAGESADDDSATAAPEVEGVDDAAVEYAGSLGSELDPNDAAAAAGDFDGMDDEEARPAADASTGFDDVDDALAGFDDVGDEETRAQAPRRHGKIDPHTGVPDYDYDDGYDPASEPTIDPNDDGTGADPVEYADGPAKQSRKWAGAAKHAAAALEAARKASDKRGRGGRGRSGRKAS